MYIVSEKVILQNHGMGTPRTRESAIRGKRAKQRKLQRENPDILNHLTAD
jgi:hypothetical protein